MLIASNHNISIIKYIYTEHILKHTCQRASREVFASATDFEEIRPRDIRGIKEQRHQREESSTDNPRCLSVSGRDSGSYHVWLPHGGMHLLKVRVATKRLHSLTATGWHQEWHVASNDNFATTSNKTNAIFTYV